MVLVFPTSPSVGDQFGSWQWDGNKWTNIAHGAVPEEAPSDGVTYGRVDEDWEPVVRLDGSTAITGSQTINGRVEAGSTVAVGQIGLEVARNALVHGDFEVGGESSFTGAAEFKDVVTLAADAATAMEPVTLQQLTSVSGNYVLKAGDTMTGTLNISGATSNLSVTGTSTLTGTVTASGNVNLATTSGGVTVGSSVGPVNSGLTVRGTTALATQAGNVTVGTSATSGAELWAYGNVRLAQVAGNVLVGSTTGPVNSALVVYGQAQLAQGASGVVVGSVNNNATLSVRGATDLATGTGAVTIGSGSNHALFQTYGACNLATTTGNVIVGSVGNNNTFTTWGQANLCTQWGGVTVGTVGNFAPLMVWGSFTACVNAGTAQIGSTAVPDGVGRLVIVSNTNPQGAPLDIRNMNGNSYNEGIRIRTAANDWSGIAMGVNATLMAGMDPNGDGTFTTNPTMYPGEGALVNSRKTWWFAVNPQGDCCIDQSAPMRRGGLAPGAATTATTPPDAVSRGFYIRRSDNRIFMNGVATGYGAWRNYATQLVYAAGVGPANTDVSRIYSNGSEVRFFVGVQTVAGAAFPRATTFVTFPAAIRPAGTRYFVMVTYRNEAGTTVGHAFGNAGLSPNGTMWTDVAIPIIPSNLTGYIFVEGTYWISGYDPPAA